MSFRKEIQVSSQSPLGKKDLKTLRKDLAAEFPALASSSALDALVPVGGEWNAIKLKQSGTVLYQQVGKPPTFFDLEGRGDLWPTLYALWAMPDLLPALHTHGPVSKFLVKGADMMLPGLIVPEGGLEPFPAGAKRCVRVQGNPLPVAVGSTAVSAAQIGQTGLKGKGMVVHHVYRDALWSFGGRVVPNSGFGADEVGPCEEETAAAALACLTLGGASAAEGAAEDSGAAPAEEDGDDEDAPSGTAPGDDPAAAAADRLRALPPDELLLECLLNALQTSLSGDKAWPLDAADVYAKHMQPAKPGDVPLDAKKSSYKQVGKFFKVMVKQRLLTAKEHKGELKITAVDRNHALLAGRTPSWPVGSAAGGTQEGAASASGPAGGPASGGGAELEAELAAVRRTAPPKVQALVGPTHYLEKLFAAQGVGKGELLTREEALERVLYAHLDAHSLEESEGTVRIDEALRAAVFKVAGGGRKEADDLEEAPIDEVEAKFEERLQQWHRVDVEGREPRVKKGPLPHVVVATGRAAGHNKTTVHGLETYHIDPDALARYGRRLFNCTASVAELPGKQVHDKEVTFHGHCVRELVEHLTRVYMIPKEYIDVHEKKR